MPNPIVIVSAPSGGGKTTIINMLLKNGFVKPVSYTTRTIRKNEIEGKDYYFISKKEFYDRKKKGEFLETVSLFAEEYGTSYQEIETNINQKKKMIMAIDVNGMLAISKKFKILSVFLMPPSIQELKKRMLKRGDNSELIEKRMTTVEQEIESSIFYHFILTNKSLQNTYNTIVKIIDAMQFYNYERISNDL